MISHLKKRVSHCHWAMPGSSKIILFCSTTPQSRPMSHDDENRLCNSLYPVRDRLFACISLRLPSQPPERWSWGNLWCVVMHTSLGVMLPHTVPSAQIINIQIKLVYLHYMSHHLYNPLFLVLLIKPYKSQIRDVINNKWENFQKLLYARPWPRSGNRNVNIFHNIFRKQTFNEKEKIVSQSFRT